ncbi:MAG: EamA family transporter [archaeon]
MWIYYVLLAVMMWSVSDTIAKIMIDHFVKHPFNLLMFIGLTAGGVSLATGMVAGGFSAPWPAPVALAGGLLWFLGSTTYMKALEVEELSRVAPLIFIKPIVVLVIAYFLLGEVFTLPKYAGIAVLLVGAVLLTLRREGNLLKKSSAIKYVAGFVLAWGLLDVFAKYYLDNYVSFLGWITYFLMGIALSTSVFWLSKEMRAGFFVSFSPPKVFIAELVGALFIMLAMFPFAYALTLGPVTLISAANATQTLFTVLLASAVTLFMPKMLSEGIDKKSILLKFIAVALIILGVYLVSI